MENKEASKGCLLVGEGVTITGEVTLPGAVFLEGTVIGQITADEVFVGVSGEVKGSVVASKADIRGIAGDSIEVHDHITVRESARIKGNLTYRSLEIERGGVIEGQLICVEKNVGGKASYSDSSAAFKSSSADQAAADLSPFSATQSDEFDVR